MFCHFGDHYKRSLANTSKAYFEQLLVNANPSF